MKEKYWSEIYTILENRLELTRSEPSDMSPKDAYKHWSKGSGSTVKFGDCTLHFEFSPIGCPTGSPGSLWIVYEGQRNRFFPKGKTYTERWDAHYKMERTLCEEYVKRHPPDVEKKISMIQQTLDVRNKVNEEQRQKLARIESILKEK